MATFWATLAKIGQLFDFNITSKRTDSKATPHNIFEHIFSLSLFLYSSHDDKTTRPQNLS